MTNVPIAAPAEPARKKARKLSLPVVIASTILSCWTLVALIGPLITPHDPTGFVANDGFVQVEGVTLLGTDYLGRDLFSRIIDGTRITLFTAFVATLLAHGLGSSFGILATVQGGWLDTLLSRIVDIVLSLPKIIVGLVVIAATGPSLTVLILVTGVVYAAAVFRIARALSADVAQLDFVRAARARGESALWLIGGEILPNIAVPLAADFALRCSRRRPIGALSCGRTSPAWAWVRSRRSIRRWPSPA
jgi:peptide/nickel transport system permease protein